MHDFEDLSDEYYRVEIVLKTMPFGRRLGAKVFRRDANERVGYCSGGDSEKDGAFDALRAELMPYLASLQRPPHQWGQLELRRLLMNYRKYNDSLTSILFRLGQQRESGELTDDSLHSAFWEARQKAIKGAIALTWRLAALPEQDRIDLMTSSEAAYRSNGEDAWLLDDLDGRAALFGFIHEPSEAVIQAYEAHIHYE